LLSLALNGGNGTLSLFPFFFPLWRFSRADRVWLPGDIRRDISSPFRTSLLAPPPRWGFFFARFTLTLFSPLFSPFFLACKRGRAWVLFCGSWRYLCFVYQASEQKRMVSPSREQLFLFFGPLFLGKVRRRAPLFFWKIFFPCSLFFWCSGSDWVLPFLGLEEFIFFFPSTL